jgi:microtubule-associated protein, RP/EB family
MNDSIGMLSEAYFASRTTILHWLNDLLGIQYTKIEQTASGIAACQIFDALFPGLVKLEKANFSAKRDYEFVTNYKVLQAAFVRAGISKEIDVERLCKAKYQDNLEFMQWVKGFFDSHASEDALNYDGAARRAALGKVDRCIPAASASVRRAVGGPAARCAPVASAPSTRSAARQPVSRRPIGGLASKENRAATSVPASPVVKKSKFDALQAEVDELNQTIDDGETERLFYFDKLREIEVIVQALEDQSIENGAVLDPSIAEIKAVLYRTDPEAEDGGFDGGEADELLPEEGVEGEYYEEEEQDRDAYAEADAAHYSELNSSATA